MFNNWLIAPQLSALKELRCLSAPISVKECVMNMPAMVCVLREFGALRNLVLSWGRDVVGYDSGSGNVGFMTRWLVNAVQSENANLRINLDYWLHHESFRLPEY
jgi:hypothetical protein